MYKPRLSSLRGASLLTLAPLAGLLLAPAQASAQPAPTCPANSIFVQEPYDPALEWVALSSDIWAGTRWYERYSVDTDVCDVHWWGVLQIHDSGLECFENPIEFEIAFWEDMGGMPAPTPACTYSYPVLGVDTGYTYDGLTLYEYSVDLQPCCPQTDGWISIQAVCICDPDCWFWWMGSPDGDLFSWYEQPAGAGPYELDPSICLTHETVQPAVMYLDGPCLCIPISNPITTWHELWPAYCTNWQCIDWVDNGASGPNVCDYILLDTAAAPAPTWWHIQNVTATAFFDMSDPPMPGDLPVLEWVGQLPEDVADFDPVGLWHEVWPNFCTTWECTAWVDDNGSGEADPGDWLVFSDPGGAEISMLLGKLSRDLKVIRDDPPEPVTKWLDSPDFSPFEPIPDPRGPWHELWPTYCRNWDVMDWVDNDNGVLDPCDYILLDDALQAPAWWHVEKVTVTVLVSPEDPTIPPMYLDWEGPIGDPFDPLGPWHEAWPAFCTPWMCVFWDDVGPDPGVLDPGDWLCFEDPDHPPQMICTEVITVGTDVELVREDPPEQMWLDGPDFPPFEPIPDPSGLWHELWPDHCQWWACVDWLDNDSGILDVCDYIKLEMPGEQPRWWHVENVTLTVTFDQVDPPYLPPIYMEWMGSMPSDPADFDPLGTWHEVFPTFSMEWLCVYWEDSGSIPHQVDPCDTLCFEDPANPPEMICMHVGAVATDLEVVEWTTPCPWDCGGDDDRRVGIVDFLALLGGWGQDTPCDFDGGGVGITDFLKLLAMWGPCPP
jgi:hypothetical protein